MSGFVAIIVSISVTAVLAILGQLACARWIASLTLAAVLAISLAGPWPERSGAAMVGVSMAGGTLLATR